MLTLYITNKEIIPVNIPKIKASDLDIIPSGIGLVLVRSIVLSISSSNHIFITADDPAPRVIDSKTKKEFKAIYKSVKESKVNEEYVESMNIPALTAALSTIDKQWSEWKNGPMTEPSMIRPAKKELLDFIMANLKKSLR